MGCAADKQKNKESEMVWSGAFESIADFRLSDAQHEPRLIALHGRVF
jgi:hypothetical protein